MSRWPPYQNADVPLEERVQRLEHVIHALIGRVRREDIMDGEELSEIMRGLE